MHIRLQLWLWSFLASLLAIGGARADTGPDAKLIESLRQGGYVLLMRHASSPRKPPDPASANSDNQDVERQLDEAGRTSSRAMGNAIRKLRIPIGEVLSSPTYRARETVRYAAFGEPTTVSELGDRGQGMQSDADGSRSEWLRKKLAERPRAGTNVNHDHSPAQHRGGARTRLVRSCRW